MKAAMDAAMAMAAVTAAATAAVLTAAAAAAAVLAATVAAAATARRLHLRLSSPAAIEWLKQRVTTVARWLMVTSKINRLRLPAAALWLGLWTALENARRLKLQTACILCMQSSGTSSSPLHLHTSSAVRQSHQQEQGASGLCEAGRAPASSRAWQQSPACREKVATSVHVHHVTKGHSTCASCDQGPQYTCIT